MFEMRDLVDEEDITFLITEVEPGRWQVIADHPMIGRLSYVPPAELLAELTEDPEAREAVLKDLITVTMLIPALMLRIIQCPDPGSALEATAILSGGLEYIAQRVQIQLSRPSRFGRILDDLQDFVARDCGNVNCPVHHPDAARMRPADYPI